MAEDSIIKLTTGFNDPELDSADLETHARNLLKQVKEIESVGHVLAPNTPEGSKSVGGILVGLLTAEISRENLRKVLGFLSDRLGNKLNRARG